MGFLAEHCTIGFFTEEEFEACQPFTCGKDEDMDDFFRKLTLSLRCSLTQ